jgi:acetate kinase
VSGNILTLNAGSSSLKFALFENNAGQLLAGPMGTIDDINTAPHFQASGIDGNGTERRWPKAPNYSEIVEAVLAWAERQIGVNNLVAVGHRTVHGGPNHNKPQVITPALLADFERLVPLAPLHEPHNIAPMRAIAKSRPALLQVACFDTAFHHDMPAVATRFAIPRRYEAEGIRRYGFHGLSYEYISGRLREIDPDLAGKRIIAAHLGNGASLCAMQNGRSIDTTMGFSALDGLVMGTRCGDLDPGVILYLLQQHAMRPEDIESLLYNQSGLLGLSGISADMRILLASMDPNAQAAIALFVHRLVREIGAMIGSLGGLDGLVFTAGIGEHAPEIRAMTCEKLKWLGVVIDPEGNRHNSLVISRPDSNLRVLVIPTNEELMIARHTLAVISDYGPELH